MAALHPWFEFDPDDDELVAHYLLPRLRGQPLPFEGVVVEADADPLCSPPWELAAKYKRNGDGDTFFFAAAQARSGNCKGSKQEWTCAGGGHWEEQKKHRETLRAPGTGEEVAWQRYALTFHAADEQGSTGWVMHGYGITAPAALASSPLRAYRVRFNMKRETEAQDSLGDGGGNDDDAGARAAKKMAEATLSPLVDDLAGYEDAAGLVDMSCRRTSMS